MARNGEIRLVEVKTSTGKTTPEQIAWGLAIGDCYRLWRPKDWSLIEMELR